MSTQKIVDQLKEEIKKTIYNVCNNITDIDSISYKLEVTLQLDIKDEIIIKQNKGV